MKNSVLVLLSLLAVFSCNNSDDVQSQDDSAVQLSLSELETTELNQQQRQYNNYFDTAGKPTSTDVTLILLNDTRTDVETFTYNADGTIDSYNENNGFETDSFSFNYESDNLTSIDEIISGPGGRTYQVSYIGNTIEVLIAGFIDEKLIYNFSNTNYQQLLNYELVSPYEDENSNPTYRFEYNYNQDANISDITKYTYNNDTNQLEVEYIETISYDDKLNPFRMLYDANPLVVMNLEVIQPASFSVFRNADNFASHNITNRTRTYQSLNQQRVTNYTYVYNEFDYPISSNDNTTIIDTDTGEQNEDVMRSRTYTYYEQ